MIVPDILFAHELAVTHTTFALAEHFMSILTTLLARSTAAPLARAGAFHDLAPPLAQEQTDGSCSTYIRTAHQ